MNNGAAKPFRVVVAADLLTRVALATRLWTSESVRIVGEAAVATEVLFVSRICNPDAVVLDVRLGGLETIRDLKSSASDFVLILLSDAFDAPLRLQCERLGANYFFDHHNDLDDIVALLEKLAIDPQLRGGQLPTSAHVRVVEPEAQNSFDAKPLTR